MKLDTDRILDDFLDTLPDFCDSCIPNGSRRGDEWDCSDIFNSELSEGDRGSCSVNLRTGKFKDQNPGADVQSGGPYTLFSAITGLKGAKAYRAMEAWNKDRTLPDGTKGVASGKRVELSEGSTIEAQDKFEVERLKDIGMWQNWKKDAIKNGPPRGANFFINGICANEINAEEWIAEKTTQYENSIAWLVSDIFTRRWLQAVECTQDSTTREKFSGELAEMRGLSKEVFCWLIDEGYLACVYERKETPQPAIITDEGVWEEPPPIVKEYFNIAFPVCRDVTPDMSVPHWAGRRYNHPDTTVAYSPYPEEIGLPLATVQFFGMHIPYTDRHGVKHWCYKPKGCPSYPYIIGDVATADLVVITESTWDAIAFIDLRKLYSWKRPWCTIVTRGASNATRFPADQIKTGAVVVRLLQNDAANAAWVRSLPAIPQAEHREIKPPKGIKDLNDWIREAGADGVFQSLYRGKTPISAG
jgi:hypothetical protein